MRLKQGLTRKAVLRTAPGVFEERHATWLELFYDLAFVAIIGMIGSALVKEFNWPGVLRFCMLFIPIWWAWVGQVFYLSRFDSDDILHRLFAFLQIIFAASMAIFALQAFEGKVTGFALSYAGIRLVLVLQYLVAGSAIPKARRLTRRYAFGFSVAAICWICSAFVPPEFTVVVWAVAILIDFITPNTCPELAMQIPPDYSHIPERFGLFTIIVLGETILAAVSGLRADALNIASICMGVLGLLLSFAFWWIYFDGVKGHQVQIPKHTKEYRRIMVWLFSHLPLSAGIVIASAGVKYAIQTETTKNYDTLANSIYGAAVAMGLVAIHTIYFVGINRKILRLAHKISLPHYITTLVVFLLVPFCPLVGSITAFALVTALMLFHACLTLRDLPEMDEALKHVESAKGQTAANV